MEEKKVRYKKPQLQEYYSEAHNILVIIKD